MASVFQCHREDMVSSMKFRGGTKVSIQHTKMSTLKQETPFKSCATSALGNHSL